MNKHQRRGIVTEGKNPRDVNAKPNDKPVKKPVEYRGGFYTKAEKEK